MIPSCYLFQGQKPAWFSVVASNLLPVHVTTLSNADAVYEKHAGRELLKVRGAAVVGSQLQTGRPSRLVKHPSWGTTAGKPAHVRSGGLVPWESGDQHVEWSCTECMAAAVLGESTRRGALSAELLFLAFRLIRFAELCSLMLGFS